jgi:hypothetical protein
MCIWERAISVSNLKLPPPACPGTTCIHLYKASKPGWEGRRTVQLVWARGREREGEGENRMCKIKIWFNHLNPQSCFESFAAVFLMTGYQVVNTFCLAAEMPWKNPTSCPSQVGWNILRIQSLLQLPYPHLQHHNNTIQVHHGHRGRKCGLTSSGHEPNARKTPGIPRDLHLFGIIHY